MLYASSRYNARRQAGWRTMAERDARRMAGLSLYWLAGLPTRDATNSFKAYRRELIDRIRIESTAGFCMALELTVKGAHHGRQDRGNPRILV